MIVPSMSEVQQKVVKLAQELLLEEADRSSVTPAVIEEKINAVLSLRRQWGEGLDRAAVVDELIRRFSIWIGQDAVLVSNVGHVAWLNSTRKRDWRLWQRYREWLERTLSFKAVEALDHASDTVLGLLEDPERAGPWDRRGLVVGHVQSGKTGNYTGLICKAADAGYKIVIVLAGLHNNLRSQTQMRLDEGFLGFATTPVRTVIGVGEIDADPKIRPNFATSRADNGDFNRVTARNLGISPEERPWLFVVKKNKTVLNQLHTWIGDHVADTVEHATGIKVVTHLPLLLIDDEADHASVDTGEQVIGPDGQPDDEHQPTAINSAIRKILRAFSRSAYVGYTATPFANIFIHERGETTREGPDLFPAAFIVNLAAPSTYVGPASVFGLRAGEARERGLPLVRTVDDDVMASSGWMPQKHKSSHIPRGGLPVSLVEAIDAFLLACAERRLRGQADDHCSMLVHVTRLVAVQNAVKDQVADHFQQIRQRILRRMDDAGVLVRLKDLWERDFVRTNATIRLRKPEFNLPALSEWHMVVEALRHVVSEVEVRAINGTAKDALDYADRGATGLKVIAIGGDKLSRGLTLEGLCVSYFLRAAKMYDTLMQMGRWFGYRPGYLDLCRLYTATELVDWFEHITDAAEELREELDQMAASGSTPREYGLKVQSHPTLMVTSPLKMRSARNLLLSFSGDIVETISLYRDTQVLKHNLRTTNTLLAKLVGPDVDPARRRGGTEQKFTGWVFSDVPFEDVAVFLDAYKTHPDARKVNSVLLAEFVRSMAATGELTNWTVALLGGGNGGTHTFGNGASVQMLERVGDARYDDKYAIGRLLSPRDETIDLDEAQWLAALAATRAAWRADPARFKRKEEPDQPGGVAIRKIRGFGAPGVPARPDRGLLLLYTLDPQRADALFASDTPPVIAFGISFPASSSGVKVEYQVNNVLWEQQYGPAE
jgi:Z1 domain